MKFRYAILFALLFFSIFAPGQMARAQDVDYVAAAVEALQTSNIYVAPGIPGTSSRTSNDLSTYLTPGDNIVLVMLPVEAAYNTDMQTIARRISEGLSNQKTIGLAVGEVVFGYSEILPSGIATSQMIDANSVSNSSSTALSTFARNIQIWLVQHPQPSPTPSPEPTRTPRPTMVPIQLPKIDTSTTSGKVSFGFVAFVTIFFLVIIIAKLVPWLKRFGKFGPAIKMLPKIEEKLPVIEHARVKTELGKACKLAWGLIEIYKGSMRYTGMGEDLFLVLISNIYMQVNALIAHETYSKLIPESEYDRMIRTMLNYDDLFKTLQKNDPEAVKLMEANIMSENTMLSQMGYFPTQK